ncbi:MAG TPA: DUF4845 domain-containing protein [Accumulibacter sp.]|jgi:hypothetical protein|uniref:DUF4845 domain-containing protein n=1 Tax=Accumulibacter sp. TaxID=2053492 RepID=UPI002C33A0AA|nr:DUF4845 domain-containing protein [Accumulibacter sp.]HOG03225.1 DUF4845 domain-containing protein [Accumulibacter sp.]HPU79575.1 DUF4845 domain-containing protein [Accumulibacter sp.]
MNRQRGLALSALLVWGVVITLVAILVIRVLPEVMDYYKIRQAVKAVAADSGGKTVAELRQAFGKYAEVEHIKTLAPAELDIFKEENQVVIAFAYEKRIPLAGNVSLLIDFRGSSSGRNYGQ